MAVLKQAPKYRYLNGYNPALVRPSGDNMGAVVSVTAATLLNGPSAGEQVTEVKMNQIVRISSPVGPRKFNAMAGYNPKLAELGTVSMNPILEDGETLELIIKARAAFTLAELGYIFRIWIME